MVQYSPLAQVRGFHAFARFSREGFGVHGMDGRQRACDGPVGVPTDMLKKRRNYSQG